MTEAVNASEIVNIKKDVKSIFDRILNLEKQLGPRVVALLCGALGASGTTILFLVGLLVTK